MPKFGSLPNGNKYNEWYGEVTPGQARLIRQRNLSPADVQWLQQDIDLVRGTSTSEWALA